MIPLKKLRLANPLFKMRIAERKICYLNLIFSFLLIIFSINSANAAERIETVESNVTSENFLPAAVRDRMEESVSAIGSQLIMGHELPLSDDWRKSQENTVQMVFDKILVGYTVKNVSIQIKNSTAVINVNLLAWTDTIKKIQVNANIEGMPEELEELAINDLASIDEVFTDCLQDLPIAATDWTNGILKRRLNKFMEESLPEFRADFDLKIKNENNISTATIDLNVYPRLPVVRIISLSMRSDTIPNVALVTHRTFMENKVNILVGVPVAFINRHKEEIEKMLTKPLDEQKDFRALKMKSVVNLEAAEKMEVMIRSDSTCYKMRASGWVDVGRDGKANDDILFRLHVGRKISKLDEGFLQTDIKPQDIKMDWALGYSRNIFSNTNVSIRYNFTDDEFIANLEYEFLKNWLARYERKFKDNGKEAAIRYKLHDFLSVEWAVDRHESWLRFIGNF